MTRRGAFGGLALALVLAAHAPTPAAAARAPGDEAFIGLGDQYIDHVLRTRPQQATRRGVHTWDGVLVPVTQRWLQDEDAWLRGFEQHLASLPRKSLSFERALEYDLLRARIDRERLDFEVLRPYETNPNAYLELIGGGIQSLLERDFASASRRAESVTRRLRAVPEVLRAAKINLQHPPRIATEAAIGQYRGVLRLYREQIPAATAHVRDARLQADLAEADTAAVQAVTDFLDFLEHDLLARSDGAFAIGREAFARKLRDDELETTPIDTLLAEGRAAMAETRARMEQLAARVAPGQGVPAALDSLAAIHPDARHLVPAVAAGLDSIRAFLRRKNLLTMPAHEDLRVRETPVFQRSASFASMDAPGVWEKQATAAYFNVTPPDSSWSARDREDHLAFFNAWAAPIVSIHEALPGHYYQFLALRRVRSRLRQFLGSGANTEGWAHYCEQMMVEQGFGGGDPRVELAQQELALQRLGRFVVGLSLHTQGMTYDEAEKLYEEQCWMAPVNAAREARRGTMDPTYIVYTLGKWQILALREEVRSRLGGRFRLKDFHDAFLRQGNSALPVVREAMLRDLDRGK